jgi:hypothetical protein
MDYKDLVASPQDSWAIIAQFSHLSQHEGAPLEAYNK